jgi:hypothetical protein
MERIFVQRSSIWEEGHFSTLRNEFFAPINIITAGTNDLLSEFEDRNIYDVPIPYVLQRY